MLTSRNPSTLPQPDLLPGRVGLRAGPRLGLGEHGQWGGGGINIDPDYPARVYVCSDKVAISPNDPDDPPKTKPCQVMTHALRDGAAD